MMKTHAVNYNWTARTIEHNQRVTQSNRLKLAIGSRKGFAINKCHVDNRPDSSNKRSTTEENRK